MKGGFSICLTADLSRTEVDNDRRELCWEVISRFHEVVAEAPSDAICRGATKDNAELVFAAKIPW